MGMSQMIPWDMTLMLQNVLTRGRKHKQILNLKTMTMMKHALILFSF